MKKLKIILCSFMFLLVASCSCNTSFTNRESDVKEAQDFANKFYDLLKANDFDKTYSLYSEDFYEVTDTPELNKIYQGTLSNLGEIKNINMEQCETRVVNGTDSKAEYVMLYKVDRAKYASEEMIRLEKQNSKMKILSYRVNSEGFVKSAK
jgi:hypothetical protein